jgi:hypothetical protein
MRVACGRERRLVAIGAIAAALVTSAIAGCGREDQAKPSGAAVTTLLQVAKMADRLSTSSGYPFSTSLANQLHLSDPATVYEPLPSPARVPSAASVGVYATASTLWLSKRVPGGLVMQLRRVKRGPARGTYGPRAITPSGLANGDFATPLDETWSIQRGPIARVTRDPTVSRATPASLRIHGTGRRSSIPTLVFQTVEPLASRAVGTAYTVDFVARTNNLSRPLSVESKLDYRDGSYEFFVATPRSKLSAGGGIPKGTSRDWLALEIQAVAQKRVSRLTVYAADTGVIPLRGTAWIDDVTLVVTKP